MVDVVLVQRFPLAGRGLQVQPGRAPATDLADIPFCQAIVSRFDCSPSTHLPPYFLIPHFHPSRSAWCLKIICCSDVWQFLLVGSR